MTNKEFAQIAIDYSKSDTCYVMGGTGQILTGNTIAMFTRLYPYNKSHVNILNQKIGSYALDCSGLIKTILWGNIPGDYSPERYGNGCPDINADTMYTRWQKRPFSEKLVEGDIVWMRGHVGIYIGNERVVEATPKWKGNVQITNFSQRTWKVALINPWVTYVDEEEEHEIELRMFISVQKGDTLSKIARRCKIKLKELIELNPQIEDPNKIYPGDQIRIK